MVATLEISSPHYTFHLSPLLDHFITLLIPRSSPFSHLPCYCTLHSTIRISPAVPYCHATKRTRELRLTGLFWALGSKELRLIVRGRTFEVFTISRIQPTSQGCGTALHSAVAGSVLMYPMIALRTGLRSYDC